VARPSTRSLPALSAAPSVANGPAPIQVGKRWVVERTNSWLNDFGRLRRCTERRRACVDAYLALAAAIVTVRALRRAAWYLYRWNTRPRSPQIR
jgi:DDE family transposase